MRYKLNILYIYNNINLYKRYSTEIYLTTINICADQLKTDCSETSFFNKNFFTRSTAYMLQSAQSFIRKHPWIEQAQSYKVMFKPLHWDA